MDELKNLVIQTLETNGILGQIRAKLRSSVFKVIDNNDPSGKERAMHWENPLAQKVLETTESALAADLIREYLEFYRLDYSLSIFIPEANLKQDPLNKNDLKKRSEVENPSDKEPLLVQILRERKTGGGPKKSAAPAKKEETKNTFITSESPKEEKPNKYSSNQGLTKKPVEEPKPIKKSPVEQSKPKDKKKDLSDYDDDFDQSEDEEIKEVLPHDDIDYDDGDEHKMFSESGNAFTGSQSMGMDPSVNTLAMDEYDHIEEVMRLG